MFKNLLRWGILPVVLLFALSTKWSYAEALILTAPPRESRDAGIKLYGPLAQHLSRLLGVEVKYQHPGNWLNYQRKMRDNQYDIVFDGPHFISWRMANLDHGVLVKLPRTLEFYLVARASDDSIATLNDLIGQRICGISPPNLSTLTVLDKFRNPVRQPVIKGIKGGMGKVFSAFRSGQCKAAVLRSTYFNKKLSDQDRAGLKILFHSKPLPNQAISVSRRLKQADKGKIIKSLTEGEGIKISAAIIKRFAGKKAQAFIPASNQEYEGHNALLEGVIFGW